MIGIIFGFLLPYVFISQNSVSLMIFEQVIGIVALVVISLPLISMFLCVKTRRFVPPGVHRITTS